MKTHTMDQGLAGYVAVSCHTLYSDNILLENRYNPEVDDPKSELNGNLPAREIVSAPVFAKTDRDEGSSGEKVNSQNSLGSYPRAIIQIINKKD